MRSNDPKIDKLATMRFRAWRAAHRRAPAESLGLPLWQRLRQAGPYRFRATTCCFVEHLQATARPGIHARVRNAELSSIFYGSILRYYPEDADGFIKLDYRPPARAPPFPQTGRRKLKTPPDRLSQNWKQSK